MDRRKKVNKRSTHRYAPKKNKKYNCVKCGNDFISLPHFKQHIIQNKSCRSEFCCNFCNYIGHNQTCFNSHLNANTACQYNYQQATVATGILPNMFQNIEISNSNPNSRSYLVNNTNPEELGNESVVLTINDETETYRETVTQVSQQRKSNNVNTYLKDSRTIAGANNNQLSSTFQIDNEDDFDRNSNVFVLNMPTSHHRREAGINSTNQDDTNLLLQLDFDNNENESCSSTDSSTSKNSRMNDYLLAPSNDQPPISNNLRTTQLEENNMQPIDIRNEQSTISQHYSSLTFTPNEIVLMDLFHVLKASNSPLIVFNRIVDWIKRHNHNLEKIGSTNLSTRERFLTDMNHKLYQDRIIMKPLVNPVTLSSGRSTNVVTFSFKEMILRIVTNKSLFHAENLLIDPKNPCSPPIETEYYGDVNTGTWWKDAIKNECKKPNHILMPFCHFIDGLKIDKYGKLTVEAVLTCCLWFNRKARNRASTWFVQGFVQDQTLFHNQSTYVRDDKAQDYHDMMAKIFQEMKEIRDSGGIKLCLDFGGGEKHDVIAIPVIQFIIGDCKGNDLLCGRKGGHHIRMKGLCRDCDISPEDGDDVCIEKDLICSFHSIDTIVGHSKEELDKYSFLPIRNCFTDLSFGGCSRNIYGATPAEILHAILLGLCEYISESMELTFTDSSIYIISKTVVGIYENSRRQSERDVPDMGPFKKGLFSVKSLKAKERFARLYCLFLALSNSYVINQLCKKKRKRTVDIPTTANLTLDFLRGYKQVVEDTILFYLWMKKEKFLKSDFEVVDDEIDSRAMKRLKLYLQSFKNKIVRGGNGLRTPKFHQMLHTMDYIKRHGCPNNYDGSRGENFGKTLIKDNAKLTNKQKDTLNFDIGRRLAEEDIVNQASTIYYQNIGSWPSEFCNEIDLMYSPEESTNNRSIPKNLKNRHPRFHIKATIENEVNDETIDKIVNVDIDWGTKTQTPLFSFPRDLLKKIAARMFLGSPNIGGKVPKDAKIPGLTHLVKDDVLYRAHPCYFKKGCWYDWGLFNWDGFEDPIPGRIMMILDLSDVEIIYRNETDEINQHTVKHLTQEIWLVILAAIEPKASHTEDLTDAHFDSSIITRVKLHEDKDVWMVPLSSLTGPCFVVYNKNYVDSEPNKPISDDRTAYVVKPMREWGDQFLKPL